jgi:hypothetical protein
MEAAAALYGMVHRSVKPPHGKMAVGTTTQRPTHTLRVLSLGISKHSTLPLIDHERRCMLCVWHQRCCVGPVVL